MMSMVSQLLEKYLVIILFIPLLLIFYSWLKSYAKRHKKQNNKKNPKIVKYIIFMFLSVTIILFINILCLHTNSFWISMITIIINLLYYMVFTSYFYELIETGYLNEKESLYLNFPNWLMILIFLTMSLCTFIQIIWNQFIGNTEPNTSIILQSNFYEMLLVITTFLFLTVTALSLKHSKETLNFEKGERLKENNEKKINYDIEILRDKSWNYYIPIQSFLNNCYLQISKPPSDFTKEDEKQLNEMINDISITISKYGYLNEEKSYSYVFFGIQYLKIHLANIMNIDEMNYLNEFIQETKGKDKAFKCYDEVKETKTQHLKKLHQAKMDIIEDINVINNQIKEKIEELKNIKNDTYFS